MAPPTSPVTIPAAILYAPPGIRQGSAPFMSTGTVLVPIRLSHSLYPRTDPVVVGGGGGCEGAKLGVKMSLTTIVSPFASVVV